MIDDETLFAWLDGELDPDRADEVARMVAASPELQDKADAHRALGARLRAAFDPVAQAPLPDRLSGLAADRHEVIDLSAERQRRGARPVRAWTKWAAMAASLAIGLVTGMQLSRAPEGPVSRASGYMVASADLEQALDTRLASAPAAEGPRIGLTFRDSAGNLCRSFTDESLSGLACRQGDDWRIRGLFQSPEGQQGDFRMAAGQDPRLAELIDSTMSGEPYDAAAEKRAIEQLR